MTDHHPEREALDPYTIKRCAEVAEQFANCPYVQTSGVGYQYLEGARHNAELIASRILALLSSPRPAAAPKSPAFNLNDPRPIWEQAEAAPKDDPGVGLDWQYDRAWDAILKCDELNRIRSRLSIHEIRLIIRAAITGSTER